VQASPRGLACLAFCVGGATLYRPSPERSPGGGSAPGLPPEYARKIAA
jgi:hypothetical protein